MGRASVLRILGLGALTAPIFAWLSFSLVFPNVAWPPIPTGMVYLSAVAVAAGILIGLVTPELEEAIPALLVSMVFGTLLGLFMYSSPLFLGPVFVIFPAEYYSFYITKSALLLLVYPMAGIAGTFVGMVLGDVLASRAAPRPWWGDQGRP